MELEKQIIKKSQEKGKAFSQITLEDDYIVPDSKPDVLKVIHTQGTIVFEEPKVSNQALWINGRMNFAVLYRSEDNEWKLESVKGSIPFQEKLSVDGLEETDHIRLQGSLEDLTTSIINSRKLAVRAVVDIHAAAENEMEDLLVTGIGEGYSCEQKIEEKELLSLKYSQKDVLRIRKEMELPTAKPNIREIIYQCVDIRNVETAMEEAAIVVQGEAHICVIYRSEGEEPIASFETVESFQGKIDSRPVEPQDIFWIHVDPGLMEIEARDDYDGEQRMLGVELNFDISAKVWAEQQLPVLCDLYALDRSVKPQCEKSSFERLMIQNQAKVRLSDKMDLEKDQEKIIQICCFSGELTTERMTMEEKGLFVEGILKVHILYMTSDDFLPVAHTECYLPLDQLVELPKVSGPVRYELQAGIEQLQVNLLDGTSYEVKAQVALNVIAFEEMAFDKIVAVEETPLDIEALQKQAGLVGYVVKAGEDLWEIAKQYHTTVERIFETNELSNSELSAGQKLIIVKCV